MGIVQVTFFLSAVADASTCGHAFMDVQRKTLPLISANLPSLHIHPSAGYPRYLGEAPSPPTHPSPSRKVSPASSHARAFCCDASRWCSASSTEMRILRAASAVQRGLTSSTASSRQFSTSVRRDASWGFIGLGAMGVY